MKKIYLVLLFWLVGAVVFYLWTRSGVQDSLTENAYRMLPRGYQPHEFEAGGGTTLSYWVQMDFPAGEAVRFYNQTLEKKGWVPMKEWMGMGEQEKWTSWSAQGARAQDGLSCAYQYYQAWKNDKKGKMLTLILNYYDPLVGAGCKPTPKAGELLVTLQELPVPKVGR